MSFFEIQNAGPLYGQVRIQGSKNAVLPMMAAMILHQGVTILTNVPHILDVCWMIDILEALGCRVLLEKDVLIVDAAALTQTALPKELVNRMRSSIILLGALLGRCHEASTWHPGGCSIGSRPIDIHTQVLEALGAIITVEDERIYAVTEKMEGTEYTFPFPSVGATENAILAAVRAEGITTLKNVAKEPEIRELCNFLIAMGAKISGIGTGCLHIEGVDKLQNTCFRVCGDRIVAATYLSAAAICGGKVTVEDISHRDMEAVLMALQRCGCEVETEEEKIHICRKGCLKNIDYIKTETYPGFPTDMQSQLLAVLSVAKGRSVIEETIFEGRFHTAVQLQRMGADIRIRNCCAIVYGCPKLHGSEVIAMDLRGGAALVIAALAAEGKTEIRACHHIFRGYEDIEQDLSQLGAGIRLQQC